MNSTTHILAQCSISISPEIVKKMFITKNYLPYIYERGGLKITFIEDHDSQAANGGVLYKNMFLKISQISQGKKRLQQRCFPVKFAKFLRTTILKNICD